MDSRPIIALDFDGVLCDSAAETAVSAWRAGRGFWPEWDTPEPPDAFVRRFVAVRPFLETGYQAVIMMRLVADGAGDAEFAERLDDHCRAWMQRLGVGRQDLVGAFGAARDAWMARDLDDWLARHRFYDGVVERVNRAAQVADVLVLTTKQERFANALMAAHGVRVPPERVHGLERGVSKEDDLAALLAGMPGRAVHFVEDRAETLRRVAVLPALSAIHLYYATWGYGTPADLAWAKGTPRVRVWDLDGFLRLE